MITPLFPTFFSASATAAASVFVSTTNETEEVKGKEKGDDLHGKRTSTEYTGSFEWVFELANSGLTEDVDGDRFSIVDVLDAYEGLDEQELREVEEVHRSHHGDTHARGAELELERG